jgi:hypothetical protein
MAARMSLLLVLVVGFIGPERASAFRSCVAEHSDAYTASTRYVVGEIAFDPTTGTASGTETTYNHSNAAFPGFGECHVTYELSGSFESASGTLVLDARRTNHSAACPPDFIATGYPAERLYALLIKLGGDGSTLVHLADNGELIAQGEWSPGSTAYRTPETCTMF